jgi:hypothetical protein
MLGKKLSLSSRKSLQDVSGHSPQRNKYAPTVTILKQDNENIQYTLYNINAYSCLLWVTSEILFPSVEFFLKINCTEIVISYISYNSHLIQVRLHEYLIKLITWRI